MLGVCASLWRCIHIVIQLSVLRSLFNMTKKVLERDKSSSLRTWSRRPCSTLAQSSGRRGSEFKWTLGKLEPILERKLQECTVCRHKECSEPPEGRYDVIYGPNSTHTPCTWVVFQPFSRRRCVPSVYVQISV